MSIELPIGVKAFVVLYDEDLSSRLLGVVELSREVIEEMKKAWLAIAMYREGDRCVAVVFSSGRAIEKQEIDPIYLFATPSAILRRDPRLAEEVCR